MFMNKKSWLLLVSSVVMFLILITTFRHRQNVSQITSFDGMSNEKRLKHPKAVVIKDDVSCFDQTRNEFSLPDFEYELKEVNNIFFHETSCFGENDAILRARQACAVESAAMMNPNMTVYLLYLSPSKLSEESEILHQQLSKYANIKIRRITISEYLKNTPLEEWFRKLDLKKTSWPNIQMADILRYVTLWKFGGMYFDLDVVIMKNLTDLKNFVGAESSNYVAAGAIGFSKSDELGRKMADGCLNELVTNFRGDIWGHNAPGVITRVLQKMCGVSEVKEMTPEKCEGFNVFLPSSFYPIHWSQWQRYFETKNLESNMKSIENAFAIHVWNKLSKNETVTVSSKVPYGLVAEKFCPNIYAHCGSVF